jgi:diketogulonate reductase-like aldo/keto reductase
MPILGFGVYQNYDARTSVLQSFDAGYRHVDSAQAYRNEAAVWQAVVESDIAREDVFLSTCFSVDSSWGNHNCDFFFGF